MKRRDLLKILGVVGAGVLAPTATAVAAVLPDKSLRPFLPDHPEFAKPRSIIRSEDFRHLAQTVDALVEHVSR